MKSKTKPTVKPKPKPKPKSTKPKRSTHVILLAVRIETRPMREDEAQTLMCEIEEVCEHTILAIGPGSAASPLKGKCATFYHEAQVANKDGDVSVVATKSLSAIKDALKEVNTDLYEVKESVQQLSTAPIREAEMKIDQIDDELSDLETSLGDLEDELDHFFMTL
jgi:hypothetical protein